MTSQLHVASLPTPVGPLAVVTDADGVVIASGFEPIQVTLARLGPDVSARTVGDLGEVSRAVVDYAAGELRALDDVPVAQPGGDLLQRLWLTLRGVGPGEVVSYSALAARAGAPSAVRVAGNACARNRVAPFVPCHRVVRADGAVGNYYFGPDRKRALLAHEGWPPSAVPATTSS